MLKELAVIVNVFGFPGTTTTVGAGEETGEIVSAKLKAVPHLEYILVQGMKAPTPTCGLLETAKSGIVTGFDGYIVSRQYVLSS